MCNVNLEVFLGKIIILMTKLWIKLSTDLEKRSLKTNKHTKTLSEDKRDFDNASLQQH